MMTNRGRRLVARTTTTSTTTTTTATTALAIVVVTTLAMMLSGCRERKGDKMRLENGRISSASASSATRASIAKKKEKGGLAARQSPHDYRLPRTDNELATTSAVIFFANFDEMIAGTARRVEQEPTSAAARRDLSNLLYGRAKHRGDLAELDRALRIMSEAIALDPNDGAAYLARANQLQTMHRFPEARQDLIVARKVFLKAAGTHAGAAAAAPAAAAAAAAAAGTDPGVADVRALEAEIDYAQGRYESAIPVLREVAAERRRTSSSSVARLALLEHDLGNYDLADRLFSEAEGLIRDPNPIPVAWLNLQRGIHCQTTGQLERAVTFFREAARRIPQYVAAEEHLAETLHMLGQDDEAIRLYEGIVSRSSDPEFRGALAGLYRSRGRVAEADQLVNRATAEYATLLMKYPEAMYWHASEYFLGEGKDAPRALELLKKNAVLRPNASSFVALARAYLENGSPHEAKVAINKALEMPVKAADGFWTAAEIEAATHASDQATIETLRAKARAINPRLGMEK